MRILLANEEFTKATGSALYFIEVAGELARRGHEVAFLTGDADPPEGLPGRWVHHAAPGALGFVHQSDAATLRPVRAALEGFRPEVIYTHQVLNPAVVSLFVDAAPTVRYAHGIRLTCPTGRRMPETRDVICEYRFSPLCYLHAFTQQCMPGGPTWGSAFCLTWRGIGANTGG